MKIMRSLFLLFYALNGIAEIDRRDGSSNIFSVVNYGRMDHYTVLMFLEEIILEECINSCIMHLSCHTVSYSSSERMCELNDMEFDEVEADTRAIGWINYGAPTKVHGKFSEWRVKTACSKTCGEDVIVYHRSCDDPRPQFGGDRCEGAYEKKEPCENLLPCLGDNVALGKPSTQIGTYDKKDRNKPIKANDGNYKTRSATNVIQRPWWEVDLQEEMSIRLIKIFLYGYALKNKEYKELTVYTKKKNADQWVKCKDLRKLTTMKIDVICDTVITNARYVRVADPKAIILYLKEVEIYKW